MRVYQTAKIFSVLTILTLISITCFSQKVSENSNFPIRVMVGDSVVKAEAKVVKKSFNLVEDRVYYWYFSNKIHSTQGSFEGKLLHGDFSSFYRDGNLRTKGKFKNGLQEGKWTEWYNNGLTQNRYCCERGQRQGNYFHYGEDGYLLYKAHYTKNKLNGKYIEYNHGVKISKQKFHRGSLVVKQHSKKQPFLKRTRDNLKNLFKKKDHKE